MWNLFSTSSEKAGYRLEYMQIYNWGVFDKQVFKITPQGNNSLLTGANGSGKTSFIDALLTLLVPAKKDRFYNQSSGVKTKGDRTEESYVCGHYGDIQKEGEMSTTTQMLRNKTHTYSVLVASFKNANDKVITVFQVRWFVNREMKRAFGIAHFPLTIEEEFADFDNKGHWKKRLSKKHNIDGKKRMEFLQGPTKYGERLAHLLGMRSTKALSLFNQVVGIKVLGNLDEFIRKNMLEEKDAEAEYIQLKESFLTLMEAKTNIEKAKEQIKQLKPINDLAINLSEIENDLANLKTTRETSVFWFAQKGATLSQKEAAKCNEQLQVLNENLLVLKEKEQDLKDRETDLTIQIKSDAVGNQIRQLETEINRLERVSNNRKNKLNDYNKIAQRINFSLNPDENTFIEKRELAKEKKKEYEQKIELETENLRQLKNKKDVINEEMQSLIRTIKALQKNKNNISGRVAAIREEILAQINATRLEIPFIGELIKVSEKELAWEASIEKVLHNFALRLIVPEKYYHAVNNYVNETNLRGKIVYQRFNPSTNGKLVFNEKLATNSLVNKLTFKRNSPYTNWLEYEVSRRYNFYCVNNLKEFSRFEEFAITKEGLVKFAKGRHEKDDRLHVTRKENYVLGWDNKEKIQLLKRELRALQEKEKTVTQNIRLLEKTIKDLANTKDDFHTFFSRFIKYEEIDWQTYAKEIQEKRAQKNSLEKANDKVKELQRQLKEVQVNLKNIEQEKEEVLKAVSKKESKIEILVQEQQGHLRVIQLLEEQPDVKDFEAAFPDLLKIKYEDLKGSHQKFQQNITRKKEQLLKQQNTKERQASSLISKFKYPEQRIYEKFNDWRSDVNNLPEPDNLEFISEYQKRYEELIKDDLPRFETKFNNYLQETIINKVGDFRMFFENWSDSIKENVRLLNDALKAIDFNTGAKKTYIQLVVRNKVSEEVKEFRNLLYKAIPNFKAMAASIDGKKHHFEKHIAPLIQQLTDEKWRAKVMDVRTWFSYKAEEYYRETAETVKTYENMGQLSGGEKAQLTYTILGSAIAYQFGLTKETQQQNKSFRFIAIDEAFKAQDEEKAQYLMKLCQQLHLQLLVVTPSDNIHIVEPHISYVHFVERRNDKNSWLYNMPIKQFQEQRAKHAMAELEE